jgi:hypothetical protein
MFWRDRAAAWRAIADVMRAGGVLATTYQPRHQGARAADAFAFAERISVEIGAAGFDQLRTEVLDLKPLPAVCVLAKRAG